MVRSFESLNECDIYVEGVVLPSNLENKERRIIDESGVYDDEYDYLGEVNLAKFESLRDTINLEIGDELCKFLWLIEPLIKYWKGRLPDLRDILRKEEIDNLLLESSNFNIPAERFIKFVARSGYKDEPDVDERGKPILRRVTPLHRVTACDWYKVEESLFQIYRRFDVNYTDEDGWSHFHVACQFGLRDVVGKFLELGLDPNYLWTRTGDSPLHLSLDKGHKEVTRLLLESGAYPNSSNANGFTPLHIMCQKNDDDEDLAKLFFKINDDKNQLVLVDAVDNSGRTPLQLAVANLLPYMVNVLLDHGADLSKFVFPDESLFARRYQSRLYASFVFIPVSHALAVVECLEKRGYELYRNDALTIIKFFAKIRLFCKTEDLKESCHNDKMLSVEAKNHMVTQNISLYDVLHHLRPEKAAKLLSRYEYDGLPFSHSHETWSVYVCEIMSRGFFRRWALDSLWELTRYQLPILCYEKIIEHLKSEDLFYICLAVNGFNYIPKNIFKFIDM
ncbi:hypothetical protein TKK_0013056 [Trichogramma kaykai]